MPQPLPATVVPLARLAMYLLAAQVLPLSAVAGEVCRFGGTTDYDGRVAISSSARSRTLDGSTTVDVTARFTATPTPFVHITYLEEEISTWTSGRLQTLAVNNRYLVDGHIVRQQWDAFDRRADHFEAYRLQGKTLDDFSRKHAGFVRHWGPDAFGQPWIQDYQSGSPERRADLDLPIAPGSAELRPPLALAFYWTRRMPRDGQTVTVVLPGFKRNKSIDLAISDAGPSSDGGQRWRTSVRHPALRTDQASSADAWVSNDGYLLQLAFTVRSHDRTASGVIRQEGCSQTADTSDAPGR